MLDVQAQPRKRTAGRFLAGSLLIALLVGAVLGALVLLQEKKSGDSELVGVWRQVQTDLANDDLDQAQANLRRCLEAWPFHAEAHFLLALVLRRGDDLAGWQKHLRTAEALQWSPEEIARERLCARAQSGDVWAVETELTSYLRTAGSDEALVREALIRGYLATRRLDEAIAGAEVWMERAPADWRPYFYRGQAYQDGRLLDRAVADYRRALERKPSQAKVRLVMADVLALDRHYAPALEAYQEVLHARPGDAEALFGVAHCRYFLGQKDEARKVLDELLAAQPGNVKACYLRGLLAKDAGDFPEALAWLRKTEGLAPHKPDVTAALAQVLGQLGEAEEARKYEAKLQELQERQEALDKLRRRVRAEPTNVTLRFEAGQACLALGRDDEAGNWFQSVLRLDPDHRPTHKVLADYFARLGNAQRAAYHRQRAEGKPANPPPEGP
jgi:predicted Zn-dependent protease